MCLAFIILLAESFRLQVMPNPKTTDKAKQFFGQADIPAKRSDIFDRNGNPLAISVDYDGIYVDPLVLKDKEKYADILSKELKIPRSELISKFYPKDTKKRYVKIKPILTREESKRVIPLIKDEKGFIIQKTPKRFYPNNTLASHVIGSVNSESKGADGVEAYYDEYIKVGGKKVFFQKDAKGRPVYSGNDDFLRAAEPDNTLYLTIDSNLQYQVERALKTTVEKYKALSGTVIIMDPYSGEIISLANYPDYNANSIKGPVGLSMKNKAIADVFEPGSIFKAITAGLALKYKVTDLKEKFWDENGVFQVANKKIREAKGHDYGWLTISDIIAKSSNIGSAKLGLLIGFDRFIAGVTELGFGSKTGIDLPGEVSGIVNKKGGKVELSNMAFGQGISVTAIQMTRAYSIIANGGYDITPHIVKKIVNKDGKETFVSADARGDLLIPTEVTKELSNMLRSVVEEGTAMGTDISGFDICGKTGTAQKPVHGGYSKDKYVSSFVGYFPASNPKHTLLVLIDEPKGQYYSAAVAVPLFRTIANMIIQNRSVAPKNTDAGAKTPPKVSETVESPAQTAYDPSVVPDLKGMSLRHALNILSDKWDDVKVEGNGRIVKQDPLPGKRSPEDKVIKIWLE